jgi:glycosyltransferase involved in cell wall biosynthesis
VAAIAPLRVGGGTRLKILEAMAAGVPVVSTPFGAEGLDVSPGRDILIADREAEWLEALEALATRRELAVEIAGAARDLVRARYDWSVLGERLYCTYCRWLDEIMHPLPGGSATFGASSPARS